ncbi:MAG: hypothetical protein WD176_04050, partial [Pirellulales bacterium]
MSQTAPARETSAERRKSRGDKGLGLFEAFGVELEYVIVDQATLDVRPVADELFFRLTGEYSGEVAPPDIAPLDIAWSNELVLHVVELKTTAPA